MVKLSRQVYIQETKPKEVQPVESKEELTRKDLKEFFKRLLGHEKGAISISRILQQKHSAAKGNVDIGFEDAFKVLVEESRIMTLNEAKMLYQFVLTTADESQQRRTITHIEF